MSHNDKKYVENNRFIKNVCEWAETFAWALCIVVLVFTFIIRIVTVDGNSMNKTLINNERLAVSNLLYTPKSGDIVILQVDGYDHPLVKRVIATEGQTVDINFKTWEVTVDGEVIQEPYVNFENGNYMAGYGVLQYPYTVGRGKVFVMGDNRNHSADSRFFGECDTRKIVGKVILRLLPINKFGTVKPVKN